MGIEFIVISALCVAISNLCMRKSIDSGGNARGYLMIQMALSFLVMVLLNPVRTGEYAFSGSMALFAIVGGVLLAAVMGFLGKSLETGPPGLSVALLSSSCVMPILLLVLLFGSQYGFYYTLWNAIGSLLVVLGVCWAGWDIGGSNQSKKWFFFISLTFLAHTFYLTFLDWRALFINFPGAKTLGLSFSPQVASNQWFLPMVFLTSAAIQSWIFLTKEHRKPYKGEMVYGAFGSVANGLGAFFMIRATEVASSLEHAMLFPIFSVTLIIGCNIWGKLLYQEEVNWKANTLCIAGLLIGTLDWKGLFLG